MNRGEPDVRRRWIVGLAVLGVGTVAFLAFGVFGVQTLFVDEEVSEAGPTFASGAAATDDSIPEPTAIAGAPLASLPPTTATPAIREAGRGSFTAVELSRLKGNVGAQNYEVPPGVDPDGIDAVSVWCKRFDSTFTMASVA